MPRKKTSENEEINNIATTENNDHNDISENATNLINSEKLIPETEVVKNVATSTEPKKQRVRVPKKEINLVIDAGRSRIKFQAFSEGQAVTETLTIESLLCWVDSTPMGERGAFALSKGKSEDKKDIVEHFVVGNSAKYQQREFTSMTEGDTHKLVYFPQLVCGAIASLPNLFDLSTGVSDKSRTLTIRLTALSLAQSNLLKQSIEQCKWIKVDGVKYRLSFGKSGFLGLPEGYGAALHAQSQFTEAKQFLTFDIGFGTSCITGYNNLGKLPKRELCSPNGGGGISTLIKEFSISASNSDSAKVLKPSQLREILEGSKVEDGKTIAIAPDGRDIGNSLELAIKNWIKDSPLTLAIEDLALSARKQPTVLCGGGFAIAPVRELVYEELTKVGIPESNLLIPENPSTVALTELSRLYQIN